MFYCPNLSKTLFDVSLMFNTNILLTIYIIYIFSITSLPRNTSYPIFLTFLVTLLTISLQSLKDLLSKKVIYHMYPCSD